MKKRRILRVAAILMLLPLLLMSFSLAALAEENKEESPSTSDAPLKDSLALDCKSAILLEANTGKVLYEQNADEALPPASVTKVMTLLLVMEAIEAGKLKLDDMISASAHAASMGGSQIYLKDGEQMSAEDMIKSVVIASANDAACALAEHIAGSEEAFVKAMNDRAASLGMKNTHFENTNGLDDTAQNHMISARDIAIMSAELIKHEKILQYSSIWMDTIRDGAFGLTNTNRLVRFYKGCTGLKTGSTSKAGFCISATAEREGVSLVAVIMGAETRDIRNAAAQKLLDWGFANYSLYTHTPKELEPLKVLGGVSGSLPIGYDLFTFVTDKGSAAKIEYKITIPESVSAPIKKGDAVGEVIFTLNGREIGKREIYAESDLEKIGFFELWLRILGKFLLK